MNSELYKDKGVPDNRNSVTLTTIFQDITSSGNRIAQKDSKWLKPNLNVDARSSVVSIAIGVRRVQPSHRTSIQMRSMFSMAN